MWDLEFDEGLTMVCHVSCKEACIVKGFWTREEDSKLVQYIRSHGEGSWPDVPRKAGLRRCSKSCRLRWRNYLRPDLKRGNYSEEEEHIILKLHARFGNRWSFIARHLPGRTDNEIKNFWNTRMKKKLRTMGIDPETHRMVAPAKIYAPDPIQFRSPGIIIPRASRPVGKPLEAAAASGRMQSIGCSVESRVQVSSEECSPNPSVGSKFFAGVPREAHIYSELNRHLVDGLDMNVLGRIQADLTDLTQQKIKFNHRVQTGIDQWRKGDRSASEQFLTDQTEQFCYYNSVASNSSCSVSSSSLSEVQQNNIQTTNTDTGTKLGFVAYNGILSPGTSTGDSDSKQLKSVQEISHQLFSPWSGLIPVISIDNYLQSMDVSGDGSGYFGGFY